MTNLERIRKELSADEIASMIKLCPCEEKGIECNHDSCFDCRLDWLYEDDEEQ